MPQRARVSIASQAITARARPVPGEAWRGRASTTPKTPPTLTLILILIPILILILILIPILILTQRQGQGRNRIRDGVDLGTGSGCGDGSGSGSETSSARDLSSSSRRRRCPARSPRSSRACAFSSSVSGISTIFSTPLPPMTTGTPMKRSL